MALNVLFGPSPTGRSRGEMQHYFEEGWELDDDEQLAVDLDGLHGFGLEQDLHVAVLGDQDLLRIAVLAAFKQAILRIEHGQAFKQAHPHFTVKVFLHAEHVA